MGRLQGKVAIVTGGAGGIGLAIAKRFCEEGANVTISDVNPKGEEVAGRIGAMFVHHDVSDEQNWHTVVDSVLTRHKVLHVLANNAGIGAVEGRADPEEARLEDWRRIFAVNAEGVFLGCKVAIAAIARSGGGSIVNISSLIAHIPSPPGFFAYGASKASVVHMTRTVALYCARKGYAIRCNSVSPGQAVTPAQQQMWARHARDRGQNLQAVIDQDLAHIPMGKFQEPVDVANAVLFLASDEARYITGTNIIVDGGLELIL
jgi:NAD(P)-dependent dehydrogenase (short-subunit alcohol dehydrogenase family)